MKHTLLFLICFFRAFICLGDNGQVTNSFGEINRLQGLSNSAVICVFQDNTGVMWFGTYDGVNSFDGKTIETFRSDFSTPKTMSDNIVHRVQQADNNCLWFSSHLGINRFSLSSKHVVANYEFSGYHTLHSNKEGNTWVVGTEDIYYYNTYYRKFIKIKKPQLSIGDPNTRCFVGEDGELWLFPNQTADLYKFSVNSFDSDSLSTRINITSSRFHSKPIEYISRQKGVVCFVDIDKDLYVYDIAGKSKIYTRNITSLLHTYGDIGNIIPFNDDVVIGFRPYGLIRLSASRKYEEKVIDRNISIFDMYKDPSQEILWIGSDGQGIVMYANKQLLVVSLKFKDTSPNLTRQIRSLMTDRSGNLWCGTKGDGLLKIPDYQNRSNLERAQVYSLSGVQDLRSYTKWNTAFEVFSLLQSRYKNGFWVGTGDTGLCYFSFAEQQLKQITIPSVIPVRHIHAIYEENDSILWLATSESGVYKLWLDKSDRSTVRIKQHKQLHLFYKQHEIVTFYSMISEGDSILWLGSREKGLVKYNMRTNRYSVISLKDMLHKAVDDILCLHRSRDGKLYAGTTAGLVCLDLTSDRSTALYVGREQGLWNDMIHGILEDANGFLWLSTNRGLIKYNPKNNLSHAYSSNSGVEIEEFSDDAYYQCPYTGNLLFGGIDGLLYMNKDITSISGYYPPILVRKLTLDGKKVNLEDYYTLKNQTLRILGSDVSFSLKVAVPDYLTGEEIEYSHILENYDNRWSHFSHANEIFYEDIPAGRYTLKIRYKKDVVDMEYKQLIISVEIVSPWYRTNLAYVIYIFLLLFVGISIACLLKKYKQLKRRIQKEDEDKPSSMSDSCMYLQFNDSLMTIYSLSEQLRAGKMPFEQQLHKIEMIRETVVARLLQVNSFPNRGIENLLPVNDWTVDDLYLREISEKVLRLLDKYKLNTSVLKTSIEPDFRYSLPSKAIWCILYYCYWYVAKQDTVSEVLVEVMKEDDRMVLSFSSSSLIINDLYCALTEGESISRITDNVDEIYLTGLFKDLVYAILKQFGSEIHYTTDVGNAPVLTFTFPPYLPVETNEKKKVLLLLEDRDEVASLIQLLLSEDYEVRQVKSISSAFRQIKEDAPVVFLMDVNVCIGEEKETLKYIEKNRSLLSDVAFIPMLTGRMSSIVQQKLFQWADSHLILPYEILYLKDIVHRALYGKQTVISTGIQELDAFSGQIVCTTTEQIRFMKKFFLVIEQNLDREELGSAFIAEQLSMSSRQFYRKFKDITEVFPSDLIKNYRIEKAAHRLLNTEAPIHEIIADVGISSRAYFYKEFTKKYGMTPKDYREHHKNTNSL